MRLLLVEDDLPLAEALTALLVVVGLCGRLRA